MQNLSTDPRVEGLMTVGNVIINCVGKGRDSECPITAVNIPKGIITCGCDPPREYNRSQGPYLTLRTKAEPVAAPLPTDREILADRHRGRLKDESLDGFFSKGRKG